jgi:hypothetical protein
MRALLGPSARPPGQRRLPLSARFLVSAAGGGRPPKQVGRGSARTHTGGARLPCQDPRARKLAVTKGGTRGCRLPQRRSPRTGVARGPPTISTRLLLCSGFPTCPAAAGARLRGGFPAQSDHLLPVRTRGLSQRPTGRRPVPANLPPSRGPATVGSPTLLPRRFHHHH